MAEFFASKYFDWLLIDILAFVVLTYATAFILTRATASNRLEETALKGYLAGGFFHLILTVVFGVLTMKFLYDLNTPWPRIWGFSSGFIALFVISLIFIIVIWLKLKELPEIGNL